MRDEQSIEKIRRVIPTVPWERLAHAYHGASDAPENLEVFLSSTAESEELSAAIEWMWVSVLHQGSVYSASPPVLWILVDLLTAWPEHPAAESILRGVQTVADAIRYFEDSYDEKCGSPVQQNVDGEPVYEAWVSNPLPTAINDAVGSKDYFKACVVTKRQLQALIRHAITVILAALDHSDSATRMAAVAAGVGALQVVPKDATPLLELANVIGNPQFDPGAWISAAMVLAEVGYFSTLIGQSDRRMRLAAAMSSSTLHDRRAIAELCSALAEPEWLEAEFPSGTAHLDMHLRFHVLTVLLNRVKAGDAENNVIEAICTLIHKRAHPHTVDMEWGHVLHWAFSERIVSLPHQGTPAPLPDVLTPPQLAILRALCAKTQLWDPKNGNASLAFKRVQLPFDRLQLLRLTGDYKPPGDYKRPGLLDLFRRK